MIRGVFILKIGWEGGLLLRGFFHPFIGLGLGQQWLGEM